MPAPPLGRSPQKCERGGGLLRDTLIFAEISARGRLLALLR